MISYNADDVRMPKFAHRSVSKWIKDVAEGYGFKVGELGYMFCSDQRLLEINKEYLGHDYFTDIITFDYVEGDVINGDIAISVDTVAKNAKEYGVTFNQELMRVMIHGVLHLTGQGDKSDEEFKEMKRKEGKALLLIDN